MLFLLIFILSLNLKADFSSLDGDFEPIEIFLCFNWQNKEDILVNNLLENQLLLVPKLNIHACHGLPLEKNNQFLLKQEINFNKKNQINIKISLYDYTGQSMWGQVLLLNKLYRKTVYERSKKVVEKIYNAIRNDERAKDVFLEYEKIDNEIKTFKESKKIKFKKNLIKNIDQNKAGLRVGLESRAHYPIKPSLYQKIATKSFLIIGADYEQYLKESFLIKNILFGGYMDLGIARPIIYDRINKNFSLSISYSLLMLKNIYKTQISNIFFGSKLAFRIFSSNLDKIVLNASMPNYQITEEGLFLIADFYSVILNTYATFSLGFSPFVQSYSINSFMPIKNFAWEAEISLSAQIFKSFFGQFAIHHDGQSMIFRQDERVVTYGQIAYLGILAKL